MVGLSYAGISQLFVASTTPPSLAAITPLSVIEDPWREQWPGGIYNKGFTRQWLSQRDRDRLRAFTKESAPDVSPRWQADDNQRMRDEAFIDSRGIAQALELFTDDSPPPHIFTYHNFLVTDGAAHD